METIDHIFQSIKPLTSYAQIIIELEPGNPAVEQIQEVLGATCVELKEYPALQERDSTFLKILMPARELQQAILLLTEAGFSKIMGLDAAH